MKSKLNKLKQHPKYHTVLNWTKLISITGSAQIIVQAVGFACGILVIRLLPVQEYAFYTLANTMLGTMMVLNDGGISAGVMAQGGKVWQDKEKLGAVLATGLDLRRKFAIWSLLVSIPILLYLLIHNNATWLTAILITTSLIPAFYASLSDSLLEIIPKLHQEIPAIQKNQIMVGSGRLLLTGFIMFIFPWAFMAVIANGLPRIYGNYKLKNIVEPFIDNKKKSDLLIRKEILSIVKKIMPGSIYFAFNGQIMIWLLALFGTSTSLAHIGALGRFSVFFSVLTSMSTMLASPYFAKELSVNKSILRFKFYSYILALIVFVIIILYFTNLFSDQILLILGSSYKNLNVELLLILIACSLSFLSGVSFNILSSMGWPTPSLLIVFGNISFVILGLFLFDIRLLKEVLYFNIFINCFPILVHLGYFYYKTNII